MERLGFFLALCLEGVGPASIGVPVVGVSQCFLTLVNVNFNVSEIEISKINVSETGSEKINDSEQ